ncbi:MAG: hypothetical protein BRD26_08495 [Bacteroidetes bacterium QH_1_64_81]|nr:MAG: hypothetical protein BRD26_08495 [Bacteroidetes bacterium QH_1_64_81]
MTLAEAITDALRRSHVRLTTAVPGHGATQTYEAWKRGGESTPPFSFHEEVAVGMAHGAALLGHRSVVLLKAHGFLKAANAIADSLAAGTTAGFLFVVFHDPTGAHSDSILESQSPALLRIVRAVPPRHPGRGRCVGGSPGAARRPVPPDSGI